MSTPSTATAVHPSHHFYPRYSDYPVTSSNYRQNNASHTNLARLAYANQTAAGQSTPEQRHTIPTHQKPAEQDDLVAAIKDSPEMPARKTNKSPPDWGQYFKNGVPKEVIVIEDTPEPSTKTNAPARHVDKRRKVATNDKYDAVYNQSKPTKPESTRLDDSSSNAPSSAGRTTSVLYSTAPTSLTSTSSGSQRVQKQEEAKAGQKRKRAVRQPSPDDGDSDNEIQFVAQTEAFPTYVPPPKPPIKAADVYVHVVRDKLNSTHKCDDEDGHYIVVNETNLTERYSIKKLLGQGTFGKVVEAFDNKRQTKCAVKIIRAVPKYRDASRIELRVLATLASNDKHNRNRCIHLRDCFDYRNHICIVTDLLGQSVFDFLKMNSFVPFPMTHIQSFARQLFTSVAFLHDLNLIHTDLKPENILLVNNAYQTFTYNRTIPSSSKTAARQAKYRKVLLNPEIRLIDFGSATFDDEYHSSVVSTRHYRAPEIILNLGWSFPCDIWSIGCILVEFFTGDALFQTHDNLEHLAMMEPVCGGKIEAEIVERVRSGNRGSSRNAAASYFKPRAKALDYPNAETPRASKKFVRNMKRLTEIIPPSSEFNNQFLDLLRRIFVYDPRKRITAKQALAHPWFKQNILDDGTEALKIRLNRERERSKSG